MGLDMFLYKVKKVKDCFYNDLKRIYNDYDDSSREEQASSKFDIIRDILVDCGDSTYSWKSIYEEVAYWRKANAIHNWFVKNVQYDNDDCGYYEIFKSNLIELRDICKEVLETMVLVNGKVIDYYTFNKYGREIPHYVPGLEIINKDKIEKLLPTKSGFFFGGTEYDEYYKDTIEYTYTKLCEIIENFDFENYHLVYKSSW